MTKAWPISAFMTSAPYAVQRTHSLAIAWTMMQEKRIRHLPVLDGTRVVGVVSLRNLQEMLRTDGQVKHLTMDAAMTADPYVVEPSTPTYEVAKQMAKSRVGSALIVKEGRLKGIFTTVDALAALAQVLDPTGGPGR